MGCVVGDLVNWHLLRQTGEVEGDGNGLLLCLLWNGSVWITSELSLFNFLGVIKKKKKSKWFHFWIFLSNKTIQWFLISKVIYIFISPIKSIYLKITDVTFKWLDSLFTKWKRKKNIQSIFSSLSLIFIFLFLYLSSVSMSLDKIISFFFIVKCSHGIFNATQTYVIFKEQCNTSETSLKFMQPWSPHTRLTKEKIPLGYQYTCHFIKGWWLCSL